MSERFVAFRGFRIWCGVTGAPSPLPPLICIPGGPGLPHDYLEPLADVARSGRQVIFYDPLGSGRSELPAAVDWSLELYVEELAAVARGLGVERFHLFAHSSAGMVALSYALTQPAALASLVLCSAAPDLPAYLASVRRHLCLGSAAESFERAEADPALRDANYFRVYNDYVSRFMCRVQPMPECIVRSTRALCRPAHKALKGGWVVYTTPLKSWSMQARLGEISVPSLITCGRYDLITPEMCAAIKDAMVDCELTVFEASSHMAHLEEPAAYVARVVEFLARADATTR